MPSPTRARRAGAWARLLVASRWCAIDTETTGLGLDAEVVQVAVVDGQDGRVVLDRWVRPTATIEPEAFAVHGLDARRLATAAPWPEVYRRLEPLVAGCTVVAFNADFDRRLLDQSCDRHGLPRLQLAWACAMNRYGDWSGHWRSLRAACAAEGLRGPWRDHHRAADDAVATWRLVLAMAGQAVDGMVSSRPGSRYPG